MFIFDASVDPPAPQQVIQIHNTFDGIAWLPSGDALLVSGGADDNVHIYAKQNDGAWAESLPPIALGHQALHPLLPGPQAAGIAVTADGNTAVVANFENEVDAGLGGRHFVGPSTTITVPGSTLRLNMTAGPLFTPIGSSLLVRGSVGYVF